MYIIPKIVIEISSILIFSLNIIETSNEIIIIANRNSKKSNGIKVFINRPVVHKYPNE